MMILSEYALKEAITQLGQREHPIGSNWGESVKTYLATVGITFPASWCAAFIYWCFQTPTGENPLYRTAGVLDHWIHRKSNRVVSPERGDIFIMDFGNGVGHTGIIEKIDDLHIYTIEGNTNDTGSREGYEVCRRKRLKTSIKGYLRY
jgi:hypothetical protein